MSLNPKYISIIKMISEGYTSKEISVMLNIKHKTVETYRKRAYQSLGLRNTCQLVAYAVKNGII